MSEALKTYEEELEFKEGFKKTKIGWIPNDWSLKILDELGEIFTGGTPSTSNSIYWNGSINWFTPSEISKSGKLVSKSLRKISKEGVKKSSATLMPKRTIIVCTRATIGDLAITKEESTTNQGFKSIHPYEDVDTEFLYYLIDSQKVNLIRKSSGSTFLELSTTNFRRFKVAIPSLPEQRKIASILSDWDKAIENTQALIDKLQLRKKGLMQQLLTGKTRLAGFNSKWRKVSIGNVATQFTDKNKNDDVIEVLSCTKYDGLVRSLEYFGRKVYGDDLYKYKIVPRGYFAYATNHIEEGSIGYQDLMDRGLVSPMYTVFRTDESINDSFMYRLLKTDRMIYNYQSNMSGSIARRGGLRWNVFETIDITIPELEEQNAIAEFFDKIDEEIQQSENYLVQLLAQKKGLMQQLLTGKIRVKL